MPVKRSIQRSFLSLRPLLTALAVAVLAGCSTTTPQTASSHQAITGPVAYLKASKDSLNKGIGSKAKFELQLHVLDGRGHFEAVAQCDQIYTGRALGGGTARELQVVLCDGDFNNEGEYRLISEPGVVSVRRQTNDGTRHTLLEYRLRNPTERAIAERVK